MDPSLAAGLEGCMLAQAEAQKRSEAFEISPPPPIGCPSGSKIGTVSLEAPTLPEGQLKGPVFLGKPASRPITGGSTTAPEYTIYLVSEIHALRPAGAAHGRIDPSRPAGY